MKRVFPFIPLLRRKSGARFTVFADGMLLTAIAATIFPDCPLLTVLAAIVATIPSWINTFQSVGAHTQSFSPDPNNIDFKPLITALTESISTAATTDDQIVDIHWMLCPVCDKDGNFITYSIDYNPTKSELVLKSSTYRETAQVSALLRPRAKMPLTVTDTPLNFTVRSAQKAKQVFIVDMRQCRLPWNNMYGSIIRNEIIKLTASAAMITHIAAPELSWMPPERLVITAAAVMFTTIMCAERTS